MAMAKDTRATCSAPLSWVCARRRLLRRRRRRAMAASRHLVSRDVSQTLRQTHKLAKPKEAHNRANAQAAQRSNGERRICQLVVRAALLCVRAACACVCVCERVCVRCRRSSLVGGDGCAAKDSAVAMAMAMATATAPPATVNLSLEEQLPPPPHVAVSERHSNSTETSCGDNETAQLAAVAAAVAVRKADAQQRDNLSGRQTDARASDTWQNLVTDTCTDWHAHEPLPTSAHTFS